MIRYIPLQTRSTPIMYRRVSGSRSSIKPAILVSNIPPNRITGDPREIGAPALKVIYRPKVTALNANPIPVLAKIPESWACCGIPRAHCHSTQDRPVDNVQQPYININRLLEILFAASFTQRSAAANAHAVSTAYLIQPMIQICPLAVNATNCYHRGSYKKKVQNTKGNRIFSAKFGFFLLPRAAVALILNMSHQRLKEVAV